MRAALAVALAAAPALARACPVCARDSNPWAALLVAALIAAPYAVAALVYRAVRRGLDGARRDPHLRDPARRSGDGVPQSLATRPLLPQGPG